MELRPKASASPKNLCFNEYHHRFSSSYSKVTRETIIFCPSFIETVNKKNKVRFQAKTANFRPSFTETVHKKKGRFPLKTAVFTKLSLPGRVMEEKNSQFFGNFGHFTFYILKLWRKKFFYSKLSNKEVMHSVKSSVS